MNLPVMYPKLILNKTYTVDRLLSKYTIGDRTYGLVLKEHPSCEFYGNRFVSLKEIRKLKINKLCCFEKSSVSYT